MINLDKLSNIPIPLQKNKIWLNYKENITDKTGDELQQEIKRPRNLKGVACSYKKTDFFNNCIESIKQGYNTGVGISLKNTGLVVVDYDKCIKNIKDNGDIEFIDAETEQRILRDLKILESYTEISPSGKGLHVYFYANTIINIKTPIEIYTDKFIRVTGDQRYYKYIGERTEQLDKLLKLYKINTDNLTAVKFKDSQYDTMLKQKFTYTNQHTDKQILDTMFTSKKGNYLKKLYYNEVTDAEYIDYKTKKLKDLKRYKKIDAERYEFLLSRIDTTQSGKAFSLIMELLDACYGDIKAVKRLFLKSKLCKDKYIKIAYKDSKGKKSLDIIDKHFIPKAIEKYKNYRYD